jgi:hypothetical protein
MSHVSHLPCIHCESSVGSLDKLRSSPCPHLLHTNHPPSHLEARSIRQAIARARNDQERLTRKIAQLQAAMDALCKQSNNIDTFLSEHEAILAPARRVLPEILSEIFLWCLGHDLLKSAKSVPVVLGKVCRYWRSVAISTPNLWSSLDLNIHGKNVQSSSWLLNTALSRSGACPLTIILGMGMGKEGDEHFDSCLDAILNHSHRWKSMFFRLPSLALKLSTVRFKHALPVLEMLDICEQSSQSNVVLDAFEVAPRLRSLCTNMSPHFLKVPVDQLEYFDCFGRSQKGCLEWLHRCSNLNECKLFIGSDLDMGLSSSLLMARLQRLNKLQIFWEGGKHELVVEDLFNSLLTPVLSDLCIGYGTLGLTRWAQSSFVG